MVGVVPQLLCSEWTAAAGQGLRKRPVACMDAGPITNGHHHHPRFSHPFGRLDRILDVTNPIALGLLTTVRACEESWQASYEVGRHCCQAGESRMVNYRRFLRSMFSLVSLILCRSGSGSRLAEPAVQRMNPLKDYRLHLRAYRSRLQQSKQTVRGITRCQNRLLMVRSVARRPSLTSTAN